MQTEFKPSFELEEFTFKPSRFLASRQNQVFLEKSSTWVKQGGDLCRTLLPAAPNISFLALRGSVSSDTNCVGKVPAEPGGGATSPTPTTPLSKQPPPNPPIFYAASKK